MSNSNPSISILLPVRNGADTLTGAVESVRGQTFESWELILIDDGSTDRTPAVAADLQRTDPRIRVLQQPPCGIVAALNHGLRAALSPMVARMDADDECFPQRLQQQHDFLRRHRDIDLVAARVQFGTEDERNRGYALHVEWTNSVLTPQDISLSRFIESPFAHPSVMFRASTVARFGGYREGPFPEDYELWLRWLEAGVRMAKLPHVLLVWHDAPHRLSRTNARYSTEAFYRCKADYLAHWLAAHNPFHPHVTVWGAGRLTRKRAAFLEQHNVVIDAYVDIDPRRIGQRIHGRPVLSPDQLPGPGSRFILSYVGSRGAREDIRERLRTRAYREGKDFIVAAG